MNRASSRYIARLPRRRRGMVSFMRGLVIESVAVALLIFLYLTMQASASDARTSGIDAVTLARSNDQPFSFSSAVASQTTVARWSGR